jgi:hypothetical protein
MNRRFASLVFGAGCFALAGCGPENLYVWGDYDTAMYKYAQDDTTQPDFQAALLTVIEDNENAGKRMPPGIYAEYGYQLLEQRRTDDAIGFFEKEKATWADSAGFMDTMIAYARGGKQLQKPAPATAAATPEAKLAGGN